MATTAKDISEEHFLQGLSSARAGLSEETCPYDWVVDGAAVGSNRAAAPFDWLRGWQFGTFVAIQRGRIEKSIEIRNALEKLFAFEATHCELCEIVNRGLTKSGLRYFSARRRSGVLHSRIKQSKEFRLLTALYVELYLPFRPGEAPYTFRIFDRLLSVFGHAAVGERVIRELVTTYGEHHGVRAAWLEYVSSEPIDRLAPNGEKRSARLG